MPSSSPNIDRFNALVVYVLPALYDSFPNPISVETASMARHAAATDLELAQLQEWDQAAASTVSWLAEEGFLRFSSRAYGNFMGVRLTMKGFTVLGHTPTSIKPNETAEPLIARLKRSVGKGAEAAATDAVKYVLREAFELCLLYGTSAGAGTGVIT